MKASILLLSMCTLVPAAIVTASAKDAAPATPAPKAAPAALQVVVNMPASVNFIRSDDVAEGFADRVATALHDQGFKGTVAYLTPFDQPAADVPLLTVNLFEWKTDPIGMVNCTFAATLASPKGKQDMGLFSGTALQMFPRGDWFGRSDQFEDAARDAMSDLYKRVSATSLLATAKAGTITT